MQLYDTPATPSADVLAMQPAWDLVTALRGGTFAMRAAGSIYLPKHPAEDDAGYAYRLSVSTLYEAFSRTVETFAAKPFIEPLKLAEETPPQIVDYTDDIDLEGRDLQAFAHHAFDVAMAYGMSHILVDYPQAEGVRTLADQKQAGARPYFLHVDPRRIRGWRSERIQGVRTLTQLRMMECVEEADGPWGTRQIEQVRILERDHFEIWRKSEQKDEWYRFTEGPVSIGCIPLATIYTGRTGFMTAVPPLLRMAHLNVEHWQSSSDQSNILHVARVPILFGKMLGEGGIKIGAHAGVSADDPAADLHYVEHSGAAIGAGRESLIDLESRMAVMGAELLVTRKGVKTATESNSDTEEANSALAAMVRNLEDSLTAALDFAAKWEGLPDGGSVELADFLPEEHDVESALNLRKLGVISAETAFTEAQRRGIIDETLKWKDEWARMKAEGMPVAVGGSYESPNIDGTPATPTQSPVASAMASLVPGGAPGLAKPGLPAAAKPAKPATNDANLQAPAAGPAAPPTDLKPLVASIAALVAQLGKPEVEPAPLDLSGLIAAINAQPAPVINLPAINVDVAPASVVVNVPEQPAAQITVNTPDIAPAVVNVTLPEQLPPVVNVAQPVVNVAGPTINVPEQPAPIVNVSPAAVTVEAAPTPVVNVTVERAAGQVTFTEDADGLITGASLQ